MDAPDDFSGAAWGGLGGLVKWFREPHRAGGWKEVVSAIIGSVITAVGVGHLTYTVMLWKLPDVPATVSGACSFVSGVSSGILLQFAVGIVTELASRFRTAAVDRIAPRTPTDTPPDGTAPADGQQPR